MTPDQWFEKYGECHQHPVNKMIHWFAVPLIYLSIIGLLWEIRLPQLPYYFNVATLALIGVMFFYFKLSFRLGMGMALWVLQFVGHKIEGKKPAFFDDVKFLLIGPLWLMGFIFRSLHIRY